MSDGDLLHGQDYDRERDAVFRYTEQVKNFAPNGGAALLGTARTEVVPLDANSSKVRTWTPSAGDLESVLMSFAGTVDLALPQTLTGLSIVYNTDSRTGGHTQEGNGVSAGTSASLTLSLPSRSEGSAAIVPDLQPTIVTRWGRNVPVTQYFFYMSGNVTEAAAITRLNTLASISVSSWPLWRPVSHVFTLKGQSVSVSADAEVQQHVSFNESNVTYTWGKGLGGSKAGSNTIRTIVLPETIHGAISISNTSQDATATATAEAGWESGGTNWPALATDEVSKTATASASVSPTSLSATEGATSVPTSGLRLHEIRVSSWRDGYNIVFMEVVNFANVG